MSGRAVANGVIVADNEALMRDVIRSVLNSANQEVFPAADGIEAVDLSRRFKARLVLLDIRMPRLNGLDACAEIRAAPGYASVPIVMLTGHSEDMVVNYARAIGANDFITKPFRPNALLARLAPYLDIPPGMVPTGAIASRGTDAMVPLKEDVWKPQNSLERGPTQNAQLANGREIMRVWRNAGRMN
jgi:DNA-binding response OmpR family regulator